MRTLLKVIALFSVGVVLWCVPLSAWAENSFLFDGEIDLSKNEFKIVVDIDEQSSVVATAQRVSGNDYRLLVDIEHLKTPLFDLLSKIESSVEVIPNKNASQISLVDTTLRGKVWSKYSLVDYKPAGELAGNFEVKDQRLYLSALSIGNLRCDGYIDLYAPFALNFDIQLVNVGMNDFLNFWSSDADYDAAGYVSGAIKASGTVDHLVLKGGLKSQNGYVQKLEYDVISLNIEGVYPHMQIAESMVSKSDGVSFFLDGPFDLSDKTNFKKQIKDLTYSPLVSDRGSEREWTIKRINPEESGVTELKYRFRQGDALGTGTSFEDETDMFGLERTRKF